MFQLPSPKIWFNYFSSPTVLMLLPARPPPTPALLQAMCPDISHLVLHPGSLYQNCLCPPA
eukprot:1140715-Pelagomonas_calceolata.AAC.6